VFFDEGGLYQTIQLYFSTHGRLGSFGLPAEGAAPAEATELADISGVDLPGVSVSSALSLDISLSMPLTVLMSFFSFFSPGVAGEPVLPAVLLQSKAVPGVFGVFEAEPKDANAPEPRPKAVEADVGDATALVVRGDIVLKGFDRPCDEVSPPPKRFELEKVRVGCSLLLSLRSEFMEREGLLVLIKNVSTWSLVRVLSFEYEL